MFCNTTSDGGDTSLRGVPMYIILKSERAGCEQGLILIAQWLVSSALEIFWQKSARNYGEL